MNAIIFTIILLCLVCLSILLIIRGEKQDSFGMVLLGMILSVTYGVLLIIHAFSLLTISYQYRLFVAEGEALKQILDNTRDNGNQYEAVVIMQSVAEWNAKLAKAQVQNKTYFIGQYIDDRIDGVEPIK